MKNIVIMFVILSGLIGTTEASAQGLRGCLGGVTDQAGCDYGLHMKTGYDLKKHSLIKSVKENYGDIMWYAKSMTTPKSKKEVAEELALEIAEALVGSLDSGDTT